LAPILKADRKQQADRKQADRKQKGRPGAAVFITVKSI
jgi:hypothetical protein